MAQTGSKTVGILAFDQMEVLDYAGPYEVFNVAGEVAPGARIEVAGIGLRPGQVTARGGFTVVPPIAIDQAPPPDILVVPGGAGTRSIMHDANLLDWLRGAAAAADVVVSVCTGALVLAAAGLLEGCQATTHHDAFPELAAASPSTEIVTGRRFVRSTDRIWTSGGISAGIDLSLHLVGLLVDTRVRDLVIAEMEWGWGSDDS